MPSRVNNFETLDSGESVSEKILKRMEAYAAMTTANNASEQEAAIALNKLNKLQEEYNITLNEAKVLKEGVGLLEVYNMPLFMGPVVEAIKKLSNVAGSFIGTMPKKGTPEHKITFTVAFMGSRHDCLYASYLLNVCHQAFGPSFNPFILSMEYRKLRKEGHTADHIRHSFNVGMAARLAARILAMCPTEGQGEQTNALMVEGGKSLAIIKQDKAQDAFNARFDTGKEITRDNNLVMNAASEGSKQANKVALNDAIETPNNGKVLALG